MFVRLNRPGFQLTHVFGGLVWQVLQACALALRVKCPILSMIHRPRCRVFYFFLAFPIVDSSEHLCGWLFGFSRLL